MRIFVLSAEKKRTGDHVSYFREISLSQLLRVKYFYLADHEKYMNRCFELALMGAGNVAPNPMVGAVLVHADKIIGEGYHQQYGQAHAEVNC